MEICRDFVRECSIMSRIQQRKDGQRVREKREDSWRKIKGSRVRIPPLPRREMLGSQSCSTLIIRGPLNRTI